MLFKNCIYGILKMNVAKLKEIITDKIHKHSSIKNVTDLEKKAGLKSNAVRNILLGKSNNPGIETLISICEILNCSIDELVGRMTNISLEKDEEKKCTPLDFDLISNSINKTYQYITINKIPISLEKFLSINAKIYYFFINRNNKKIDNDFLEWIFEQLPNND